MMKFKATLFLAGVLLIATLSPQMVRADDGPVAPNSLDFGQVISDTLRPLVGKEATLYLASGEKITGKVKVVGKVAAHIAQLSGREFYDAVVLLDKVVAVEMRAK